MGLVTLQILSYTLIIYNNNHTHLNNLMTNEYNPHFTRFLLQIPQPDYNFIRIHSYPAIHAFQKEANHSSKRNSLQSFDGRGKWTFEEQKQYLLFINENIEEMREKSTRKSNKVFLKMSQVIKTRSADQCRSHHQKVLKYHDSLQEIIRYYSEDVYSAEKIFGSKELLGKKQAHSKTNAELQNEERCSIQALGRTFKIVLDVKLITDY